LQRKTLQKFINVKIKHLLLTVMLSVIGILPTLAQTRTTTVTLKGIITDSTTTQPMAFATVTLLNEKDSAAVIGGLTSVKGDFNIPGVKTGNYILKIAYMGYKNIVNPITIKSGTREVTIGPYAMISNTKTLGEVVILGQKAPVVVKTDTVEFTAVNFKVEKNDVVEEMIKKLPGVQVDKDGNIQAHGKDVTKVMVDGKPFFGNDPKLATQNLPAEMIDKIQVIDQKSDQAQFTKIDDGQSEKVINIITKMGYKRGNFGKASLGGGKSVGIAGDDRFDLSGMFNSFKDDRQLSVIGMSNNTNVTRFTADMGASMGGGGGGGQRGGGGGGGQRGGGGGGFGFGGNGINLTNALGVNFKDKIGKLDFAASYFYNGRDNNNFQNSTRQTLLKDSSFLTKTTNLSSSLNTNHRFNMQMDYMIDSSFSIRFVPNISMGNTSSSNDKTVVSTGFIQPNFMINKSVSNTNSTGNNLNASGFLLLRKQFKKPRRTLSLNLSGNYSKNDADGFNSSVTNYYSKLHQPPTSDSIITIKQNNLTKSNSSGFGARFAYTEPLSLASSLQLDYSYNYSFTNSDKKTYDFDGSDYTLLNKRYTNHFENTYINQRIGLSIQTRKEKYDYTFGLGLEPTSISSKMLINNAYIYPKMNVVNFSPLASMNYNFSKNSKLRLEYRGRANQPDISQLQPIEDNSNPLLITKGNPNLKPEFSNSVNVNYNAMNYVNFANYYLNAQIGNTLNRITNLNSYGQGGVQTTIPVNVNGGYNTMLMGGIGRPFKNNKFVLNTFGLFRYSKDISFASNSRSTTVGDPLLNLPPQNMTTSMTGMYNLGFTINMKTFNVTSSARATYTSAAYTISTQQNTNYTNYALNMDAKLTLFGSVRLASDVSYTTNNGLSTGYNQNTILWNANITKDFFKDKRAQIKIQLWDILGQNVSIRRTMTENYIEDSQSKVLTRYFLVSFIYNFNKFLSAQKAVPQDDHGGMPGMMRMGGFRGGRGND
jgi:uncharacterized membrane protein YgcG